MAAMTCAWWEGLPQILANNQAAVLVSIIRIQGSSPRETGASMLVNATSTTDTLGGGELEYRAIQSARDLLNGETIEPVIRYVLGPEIGQCCGGVVWLLYEKITPDELPRWQSLTACLYEGIPLVRHWRADGTGSRWHAQDTPVSAQSRLILDDVWHGEQVIGNTDFHLRLFGTGHVGHALIHTLTMTDCRLQCVDSRADQLPPSNPPRVLSRHCLQPLVAVHDAPPATWFIVMTHSHALDYELVDAILTRGDAAFCGLIGSASKSARFRRRLRAAGLSSARIAELTCPIGIDGIRDKSPQAIAIAVTAQLLQLRDARRTTLSTPSTCTTFKESR